MLQGHARGTSERSPFKGLIGWLLAGLVSLGLVFGFAPTAHGSAFQLLEQSPKKLGTSFAGTASHVTDATTVFFNPAAMSELSGHNLSVGATLLMPEAEFTDRGSNTNGVGDTTDESDVIPNVYYVMPLTERMSFGLGQSVPFGLESSYDEDWAGRYLATDSELTVLNINPTFSYRLHERFSVGIGGNYQDIEAELANQIDSTFGALPDPSTDSSILIEGDDDDVALDLSFLWEPTPGTTIGVLWRQGGDFTLDGDFEVSTGDEGGITADLELPDVLNVSASHAFDERWTVHWDVAWTEWSTIDSILIETDDGDEVDELVLDYDDTYRVSIGATYTPEGPWTWRIGTGYDEAPQTDPDKVTPRIPDEDRIWSSLGVSYRFSQFVSIDLSYAHLFVDDVKIDNENSDTGNRVVGEFEATTDIVGLQGNLRF